MMLPAGCRQLLKQLYKAAVLERLKQDKNANVTTFLESFYRLQPGA